MIKSVENPEPHQIKMNCSSPCSTLDEFVQQILKNKSGQFKADYSKCQFLLNDGNQKALSGSKKIKDCFDIQNNCLNVQM